MVPLDQSILMILGVLISPDLILSFPLLAFSFFLILIGILFKLTLVPFHAWVAEGYSGMPIYIAVLIVILPKFALLSFFFRIVFLFFWPFSETFPFFLDFLTVGSVVLGGLAGIFETNILKIIGFSGIANIGYILAPIQLVIFLQFIQALSISLFTFY